MNPTTINWPGLTHTWNPAIGCLRGCCKATHGFDCYAAKLHTKRHKAYLNGKLQNCKQYAKPFNEIQYLRERLLDKDLDKPGPFKIFVGDMTDHAFWSRDFKLELIECMEFYKQHTFMLLTKDPSSYGLFKWPDNVMCGTTITFYCHWNDCAKLNIASKLHRPFLSIEPLLGNITKHDYTTFEIVIVGKDNTSGAEPPKQEWIQSVKDNIPKDKIWWK